jgi:hypothetical protein
MKRIMMIFLVILSGLILATGSARAAGSDTPPPPTPTSTYVPLFDNGTGSTPDPNHFNCPVNTPVGYGTVTPSAGWSYICDPCFSATSVPPATLTPFPLPEWAITATAQAWLTATPVPTGTPTQAATPLPDPDTCDDVQFNLDLVYIFEYLIRDGNMAHYFNDNVTCTWSTCSLECSGSFSAHPKYASYLSGIGEEIDFHFTRQASVENPITLHFFDEITSSSNINYYGYPDPPEITITSSSYFEDNVYIKCASADPCSWTGSFTFNLTGADPYAPVVPTPTPEAGYCAGIDQTGAFDEVKLPEPAVGVPVCGGINGLAVEFSALNIIGFSLPDVVIPTVEVCFQPMILGSMTYAGVTFDLDNWLFLISALFLIWIIFQ